MTDWLRRDDPVRSAFYATIDQLMDAHGWTVRRRVLGAIPGQPAARSPDAVGDSFMRPVDAHFAAAAWFSDTSDAPDDDHDVPIASSSL